MPIILSSSSNYSTSPDLERQEHFYVAAGTIAGKILRRADALLRKTVLMYGPPLEDMVNGDYKVNIVYIMLIVPLQLCHIGQCL